MIPHDNLAATGIALAAPDLCVQFANTVAWRGRANPEDQLVSYDRLIDWGVKAGALGDATAARLRSEARRRPVEAEAILASAIRLREAIYRLLCFAAKAETPSAGDMEELNGWLTEALARQQVAFRNGAFVREMLPGPEALEQMLWPVAQSAADLLTAPELKKLKICPGEGCDWLFLDHSRNQTRRWCDMADCGNRAKARRHYARQRAAKR